MGKVCVTKNGSSKINIAWTNLAGLGREVWVVGYQPSTPGEYLLTVQGCMIYLLALEYTRAPANKAEYQMILDVIMTFEYT